MQTHESQIIIKRFFDVIYLLKQHKLIRGKKTFTDRYGINRWNFNTLEKDHSSDIFQTAWLGYLVVDYGVNAEYLLTGKGKVFR